MKKTFALPLIAASLFAALFAFAGCANMEDGAQFALAKAPSAGTDGGSQIADGSGGQGGAGQSGAQEPVIVTVSGSLAFGGAFPEQIAALVDNTLGAGQGGADGLDGIARSAFPKTPDASGLTYSVYAEEDTDSATKLRYDGTVAADGKSYTVGIPVTEGKKYYVYANAANSDRFALLSGKSAVLDFTTITSFKTDANITLAATDTGKGFVELEADVAGTEIHHGRISYTPAGGITNFFTANKTGSKVKFKIGSIEGDVFVDAVPSGAYTMTFDFFTEGNELLYSFKENVSVFDNLVTNTWVQNGAEPWFVTTASAGVKTTTCKVTAAMVQGYALTDIYVDPSAPNDSGSGSYFNPKKTFARAVAMLQNPNAEYTIHIKGIVAETLSSQMAHCVPYTARAKSLTLCGVSSLGDDGKPQDALSGGEERGTLVIQSSFPITIKNLKITGGKVSMEGTGGGITAIFGDYTLTLGKDAYITGNEANCENAGGGIYFDGGELIMLDGAVIDGNSATANANKGCGGGVYLCSGKKFTMNGGVIKGNKATGMGGGVYVEYATFTMTGGVIGDDSQGSAASSTTYRSNLAGLGGGVYLCSSGETMNTYGYFLGGTIAYNFGVYGGGGIYAKYCDATIRGTIKCNGTQAVSLGFGGGGLMADQKSTIRLENCTVDNNISNNSRRGGAIYVKSQATSSDVAVVSLKGSVSIPCTGMDENDVCLPSEKDVSAGVVYNFPLTIAGKLTGTGTVATITPETQNGSSWLGYDEEIQVLKLGSGVTDTSIAEECYKFAVTPQTSPAQNWAVGSDGKLVKAVVYKSDNIGDFTLEADKEYHFVLGPDVTDDLFEAFTTKFVANANISEKSTLDLSRATKLTGTKWKTTGVGAYLQKFDTVIIGPNFNSNWCENKNIHYTFLNIKNIVAPSNSVNFSSDNGILFNKDKTKIVFYPGGGVRTESSYAIPSSVTEIAPYAFWWATSSSLGLWTITIPASVKKIGIDAFPGLNTFPTSGTLNFADTSGWHKTNLSGDAVDPSDLTAANYKDALGSFVLVKE